MDPVDLERLTDRALRTLPTPRAPRSLLPRVLAAVAAEASRPWYARAWLSWPLHWQLVSGAATVSVVVAAMFVGPAMAGARTGCPRPMMWSGPTACPVSPRTAWVKITGNGMRRCRPGATGP